MEWINPKKPDKEPKREKEGLIITKKKRKKDMTLHKIVCVSSYSYMESEYLILTYRLPLLSDSRDKLYESTMQLSILLTTALRLT